MDTKVTDTSNARTRLSTRMNERMFYAILDTEFVDANQSFDVCEQLLAGGADFIQLRAKQLDSIGRGKIIDKIWPLFLKKNSYLIINDDVATAANYPGVGVHIGQDDISVEKAREILGNDALLGLSTHNIEQVRHAIAVKDIIDYFAIGPIFKTQTKKTGASIGLKLVEEVYASSPPLPWFCIGGITRANAQSVLNSGAQSVVAISDVLKSDNISQTVKDFKKILSQ
tara:strand:- start:1334 stop:2014 length:681 start_codon:yes stop_codon:yes gene_type:complete